MLDISKILNQDVLNVIGKNGITSINEAINDSFDSESKRIELEYATRFDELVDNITRKFDDRVEGVIIESVRTTVGDNVNKKMYSLVRDMVNLLENSGIATTEKTKELQSKVNAAEEKLQQAYKEYEDIKQEKDHSKKNEYILLQLKGSHPKIIDSALEYFKDKLMIDVEDEIDAFINGDFKNLLGDEGSMSEKLGDIDINMVRDALDGMTREKDEKRKKNAFTESLGKGLRQQKAIGGSARNPNISQQTLNEASLGLIQSEEDIADAMNRIKAFDELGYRFR